MRVRNYGYLLAVGAIAAAFVLATPVSSEAKGKKAAKTQPAPGVFCTLEYKPVCATRGGMKMTYSNACFAVKDGAKVVSEGACATKGAMKPKKAKKKAKK